jgi:hypothetical protein
MPSSSRRAISARSFVGRRTGLGRFETHHVVISDAVGMYWMQLTPLGARSSESRYSGMVSQSQFMPAFIDAYGIASVRVIVSIERSRNSGLHRREAEAAVAEHQRGDAVPSGDGAVGIPANLRVVMRVQIDEAGRDDQPVGVDGLLREAGRAAADLRDLAVLDPDVAAIARHARSVDDGAAFDVKIESAM